MIYEVAGTHTIASSLKPQVNTRMSEEKSEQIRRKKIAIMKRRGSKVSINLPIFSFFVAM